VDDPVIVLSVVLFVAVRLVVRHRPGPRGPSGLLL